MPKFNYKGHDVHYELYGEPGSPVVTLCNGLSMRTSHWAPYFELLPKLGLRVLTYDMIGQGASSKPILGLDFDDHAASLNALHEHLGIERPYVMGISFGGVVVLKYAYTYPDRVGGILPTSTFSEMDEQLRAHAYNLYMGLVRVGFEFYLDLLIPLNFSDKWLRENKELIGIIKRVGMTSFELYGIQNLMESLANFESITGNLDRIQCPALIMNAEYDALTPRHLHDTMRRHIPNSRLMLIPHVCHAFTLEVPELTSRLIADFVRQVEENRWQGDQSVWIANEDPQKEPVAFPCEGDPLRFIPLPAGEPKRPAGRKTTGKTQQTGRKGAAKSGPARSPKTSGHGKPNQPKTRSRS
ncbi:alpha/beta hydrolase [Ectothiorhodospiraceae bacterium WFHF3C12]|nr:alpha/beta hydrolase [Ectothiorhodospiraceae bacterium WFHF3C12]